MTWFAAEVHQVSTIRANLRATLLDWQLAPTMSGSAELLLSELCTNVIRHTESTGLGVRLECSADGVLHVAVQQGQPDAASPHALRVFSAEPDANHGRGLQIIDALASEWGTYRSKQTTTTWFTVHPEDASAPEDTHAANAAAHAWNTGQASTGLIAALHAAVDRSQLLLRITEALSGADDRTSIADAITRTVRGPLGAVFTGIALVEDERMQYVSLEPLPADTAGDWTEFPLDIDAPVAASARENTAFFHTGRAVADAQFPGIAAHMQTAGTSAMAHLPLTARGCTFGTLALSWDHERDFDADTRALLLVVAGYTAHALARK